MNIQNQQLCGCLFTYFVYPTLAGYFALNVPSGLALYWFVNNILSTAQQVYLKSTYKPEFAVDVIDVQAEAVNRLSPAKPKKVKDITGESLLSRLGEVLDSKLSWMIPPCVLLTYAALLV